MKDILDLYHRFCLRENVPFEIYSSVKSYDETTLFCPAGMQKYKTYFKNHEFKGQTLANSQATLRVNDLAEVGGGTHFAYFNMLGLFSFRDWTVERAISFWLQFIEWKLHLKLDYVTIHPKRKKWRAYYPKDIDVRFDDQCQWSDGDIGGYCTEFYVDGVEIGNIVNPLGECIDAGFGLERLNQLVNKLPPEPRYLSLMRTANAIVDAGYKPGPTKQGYVLRKVLRMIYKEGLDKYVLTPSLILSEEIARQQKLEARYYKLKDKFPDKSREWWFSTHGIDLDPLGV